MVFSSITFIFWFLPLTLAAYYFCTFPWLILKRRHEIYRQGIEGEAVLTSLGAWAGNLCLLAASLFFYFWGEQTRIYILFTAIGLNYAAGLILGAKDQASGGRNPQARRLILLLAVACNLGMLIYFKYSNFLAGVLGYDDLSLSLQSIVLPLGISFFVFQAMSYTIDVYQGTVPPARDLVSFACYITMFPQLVAGPIVRYCDVATQLSYRALSTAKTASGIRRFIVGLAKKVLIANQMAILADTVYSLPSESVTFGAAWIGTIAYTLQIYFDFSGYSDMAIGLGRMFGFDFLENFNYPYIARSVQDFWRRWHISLSTWFRDYLYVPLGGNRKSNARTYFNLVVVFTLCGFWHGASINFLLWGLYHGLFLVLERIFRGRGTKIQFVGHVYTLLVVMFGWVLFRADTWSESIIFWKAMTGLGAILPAGSEIWLWFGLDIRLAMMAGILFSLPVVPAWRQWIQTTGSGQKKGENMDRNTAIYLALRTVIILILFLACLPSLVADTYNPFIYFRF